MNGWDCISRAAAHQQQRIVDRTDVHISHTLLARSMDEGLAKAGYDQLIRAEAWSAAIKECVAVAMKMATDAAEDATGFYRDGEDAVAKRCDYAGETLDELVTRLRLLLSAPSAAEQQAGRDRP